MDRFELRIRGTVALLLVAVTIFLSIDLVLDWHDGVSAGHLWAETIVMALCLAALLLLGAGWSRTGRRLSEASQECVRSRQRLRGLAESIDLQLRDWGLTAVERDTALLLLKGLSHRDIGAMTGRSERTVRQHAVAVYRKSGLSGRAALAACFIEDLLPVPADAGTSGPGQEDYIASVSGSGSGARGGDCGRVQ